MDAAAVLDLVKDDTIRILSELKPPEAPIYPQIAEVIPLAPDGSSGRGMETREITGMGDVEESEPGESYGEDEFRSAWTRAHKNRFFNRRFRILASDFAEIMAKGKVPDLLQRALVSWDQNWHRSKEEMVALVFSNGGTTTDTATFARNFRGAAGTYTDGLIYDEKALFASDHPLNLDSTVNFSNNLTGAALSQTTLQAAYTQFTNEINRNERNKRFSHNPTHAMVAPGNKFALGTILNSAQVPGSGNNDRNGAFGLVQPIVNPYLTSATDWFLLKAKGGLKVYDSGALRSDVWFDKDKKMIVVDVDGWFGTRVDDWRMAIRNVA